jgi:hypothetical protein
MGYDLHITRKEHWSDEMRPGVDISLEDWLIYIDQDTQLELSDSYRIKVPGSKTESQVAPGFCLWKMHPSNDKPYFHFSDGDISTKNPDGDTIQKLLTISEKLNARVQGDDGEIYIRSTQGLISGGYDILIDRDESGITPDKKPWWKFW